MTLRNPPATVSQIPEIKNGETNPAPLNPHPINNLRVHLRPIFSCPSTFASIRGLYVCNSCAIGDAFGAVAKVGRSRGSRARQIVRARLTGENLPWASPVRRFCKHLKHFF
jgi:hypothetical protein